METIQTTALLRSARILGRILWSCCHSNSNEKPSANASVKNSKKSKIIIVSLTSPSFNLQEGNACHLVDIVVPADCRIKIKAGEQTRKISGSCLRAIIVVELEVEGDIRCNWNPWNTKDLWKKDWVNRRFEEESRPSRLQRY